jgi:hypothetical protein
VSSSRSKPADCSPPTPAGTATIDVASSRLHVEGTRRADDIRVDLNATTGRSTC